MLLCKTNQFYKLMMKKKYYMKWDKKYMARLAKKEEIILHPAIEFHKNKLIKRCFSNWKIQYHKTKLENNKIYKAKKHYKLTIERKIFNKFLLNTQIKTTKRKKYEYVDNIYKNILMVRTFSIWEEQYMEKIKEQKKLKKASEFYNINLLKKIFHYYWQYNNEKKKYKSKLEYIIRHNENINTEKAESFYRSRIIKNNFYIWKQHYIIKTRKIQLKENSIKFMKKHLLSFYFNHWKINYQIIQSKINNLNEIYQQKQITIKQNIFKIWNKKAKKLKWEKKYEDLKTNEIQNSNDAKADNLYKKFITKKYLTIWKNKRSDWHSIYNHYEIQPIIYWCITLCKKVFEGWKTYSKEKKYMKKRILDAENWKKENDLKQGIVTWIKIADKKYSERMKEYEISILPYQDLSSREYYLMRKYFTKWYMMILRKKVNNINNNEEENDSLFEIKNNKNYNTLFPSLLSIEESKKHRLLPKKPRFYFDDTLNDFIECDNQNIENENNSMSIHNHSPITKSSLLCDILNNKIEVKYDKSLLKNMEFYSKDNQFNELLDKFKAKYKPNLNNININNDNDNDNIQTNLPKISTPIHKTYSNINISNVSLNNKRLNDYKSQRYNEMGYYYILEILDSEIENAKNILDLNYNSLEINFLIIKV
ncbi:hypothetical protein BCR32DRAFT_308111 [Anaeromyces robustus]|uniref:Sfi1 spindle body domain-containing protein n=1 Tax=Anaeromyces robustus TaxID=1754192 RepID=A0A1Y1XCS6_9FUNG|nr:hypothetical protein BCR32DRAFT_308111 [Anaeromyces robustus]|eukprot:ORX83570.1 hypothetical protein BCR32DRAFT_308111 [Anaeromyces robustus]